MIAQLSNKSFQTQSKSFQIPSRPLALLPFCVAFSFFIACSDTPTEVDDHHEPEMVTITQGTTTLVTYTVETGSWDDHLDFEVGTFGPLSVNFLSHDGDVIVEDDTYLDIDVEDGSVVRWDASFEGAFDGNLTGLSEGETTIQVHLMHGAVGSGHPDLSTAPLDVHIESDPH